ncbi:MAG: pilus assembly protein [Desulfovibrionaceae bacterium]|nr:pilus assembly protein [Desulfovibrionaceae bacterium]
MIKLHVLPFALLFVLISCAPKSPQNPAIERQGEEFRQQSRSRTVDVTDEPYLGAKDKSIQGNPVLNKNITLRRKGTLQSIAQNISELVSMPVQVVVESGESGPSPSSSLASTPEGTPYTDHAEPGLAPDVKPGPINAGPVNPPPGINANLEALLKVPGGVKRAGSSGGPGSGILNVSFEGTVQGLLDYVSSLSGFGWDMDPRSGSIVFARMMVRTFTLMTSPGKVTYDNKLTNKSRDNVSNTSIGSGGMNSVGQTVQTGDASSQTAQTNSTSLSFDLFEDTMKAIKSLLSSKGSVVSNPAAGTITVKDNPENVRRVAMYIDDTNTRLARQVALKIHVWSLDVTQKANLGVDLQTVFNDPNFKVAAIAGPADVGTVTVGILSGSLKNTSTIAQALAQWGNVTQVTSAGGVVMSNQPVPAMAIERTAYLAGTGVTQTQYGQTTQITPGEITTGFSMTAIPHILDGRRLILHYNINLSSLQNMQTISANGVSVQLPQVATRAFSQRTSMKMGQTLVLTGFEQELRNAKNSLGLVSNSLNRETTRTLLVITIEVESVEG